MTRWEFLRFCDCMASIEHLRDTMLEALRRLDRRAIETADIPGGEIACACRDEVAHLFNTKANIGWQRPNSRGDFSW